MSSNSNAGNQSAKATSTAAATATGGEKSSSNGANKMDHSGAVRQPRGKQAKQHKKDADKSCNYCQKLGHVEAGCYKKKDDLQKAAEEKRVREAEDIATRVACALFAVSKPAASAAPAKAEAGALTGSDDESEDSESDSASEGDSDSDSNESSCDDNSNDFDDNIVVDAALDDGFFEFDDEVENQTIMGAFSDSLFGAWAAFADGVSWLVCLLLGLTCFAFASFLVSLAMWFRNAKKAYYTDVINSWTDVRIKKLSIGDDDAFLQIMRSVGYMMRVLLYLAVVPYLIYLAWSYYTMALGTDYVVTQGVLKYCNKPFTDADHFKAVESSPDVAIGQTISGFATSLYEKGLPTWDDVKYTVNGLGGMDSKASAKTATPFEKMHWAHVDDAERVRRIFSPDHDDYCGHLAAALLTYARAVIYSMVATVALGYCAYFWYNFPIHHRPDSVRYTLVGSHEDYDRLSSMGDCRDAGFRSVKFDSPDFIKDPQYLIYDLIETQNNVTVKRRVVVSNAIFSIFNNPLNTTRWTTESDCEKLMKDTVAFGRAALQRVNISTYVEAKEDMVFETMKLFAASMKGKRVFPTNFWSPKVE